MYLYKLVHYNKSYSTLTKDIYMTFAELKALHEHALEVDDNLEWDAFIAGLESFYTEEQFAFLKQFIEIFSCCTLEYIEER